MTNQNLDFLKSGTIYSSKTWLYDSVFLFIGAGDTCTVWRILYTSSMINERHIYHRSSIQSVDDMRAWFAANNQTTPDFSEQADGE